MSARDHKAEMHSAILKLESLSTHELQAYELKVFRT